MNAFHSLKNFFRTPDLRKKFFVVLGLIAVARLVSSIPIPGIDKAQLDNFLNTNAAFSLLNVFTGGGLTNFSLAMMGVGPYISASIIFQLLTIVVPQLEALSKEGEFGRKKINQYTRLATIPLAFLQGFGTLTYLRNASIISSDWTTWFVIFMLVITTAGTMFLVWLGEVISEQGIGNGMSMLITAGIVSSFPLSLKNSYDRYLGASTTEYLQLGGFILAAAAALYLIIFMNEGTRNIPVTYARRTRAAGNAMQGTVDTHLPIKINAAGVVPIIFAISVILFPRIIAQFFQQSANARLVNIGNDITTFFNNNWAYGVVYFLLVVAFTYFYTFIIFQPKQMAENLQKQGGYIPGIRPGTDTEEYLTSTIQRLTFAGAIFLGVIAVLPIAISSFSGVSTLNIGGTTILIVVAVVLEIIRQVKAQLITRNYDAYL